jgi:membrane protease YdiL (CAAX protease family)
MNINDMKGFFQPILFALMIVFSIVFFLYLNIKADVSENLGLDEILIGFMLALLGVFVTGAIMNGVFNTTNGTSITSIMQTLSVMKFDLTLSSVAQSQPITVYFSSFATSFNIQPKMLYEILSNLLLVSVAEELVFRGVGTYGITKGLEIATGKNIKGGILIGGTISTAIWSTIHIIANNTYQGEAMLPSVLTAYIGGAVFLIAMLYSINIVTAIVAHGVFNSILTVFKYMTLVSPASLIFGATIPQMMLLFGVITAFFAAISVVVFNKRWKPKMEMKKSELG